MPRHQVCAQCPEGGVGYFIHMGILPSNLLYMIVSGQAESYIGRPCFKKIKSVLPLYVCASHLCTAFDPLDLELQVQIIVSCCVLCIVCGCYKLNL